MDELEAYFQTQTSKFGLLNQHRLVLGVSRAVTLRNIEHIEPSGERLGLANNAALAAHSQRIGHTRFGDPRSGQSLAGITEGLFNQQKRQIASQTSCGGRNLWSVASTVLVYTPSFDSTTIAAQQRPRWT